MIDIQELCGPSGSPDLAVGVGQSQDDMPFFVFRQGDNVPAFAASGAGPVEFGDLEVPARAQDSTPFNHVFQFPDIAGPVVGDELFNVAVGYATHRPAVFTRVLVQEMVHQKGYVLPAFP